MAITTETERDIVLIDNSYDFPMAGTTNIPKAAAVGLTGGYAVNVTDAPGVHAVGVEWIGVDNSAGSDGDKYAKIIINRGHTFVTTGADQTWVGKIGYLTDNETVALTGQVKAGIIMAVNSATSVDVWMHPFVHYLNNIGTSVFSIGFTDWVSHLGEDLGIVEAVGTFNRKVGPDIITIESRIANSETETCEMKAQATLPANYVSGTAVTLRLPVTLFGAGTDNGSTIDAEVFKVTDGAIGSDICATAAQALTTSWADYDFTITPTGLLPGDELSIVVTGSIIESAAADLQAEIGKTALLCNAIG